MPCDSPYTSPHRFASPCSEAVEMMSFLESFGILSIVRMKDLRISHEDLFGGKVKAAVFQFDTFNTTLSLQQSMECLDKQSRFSLPFDQGHTLVLQDPIDHSDLPLRDKLKMLALNQQPILVILLMLWLDSSID